MVSEQVIVHSEAKRRFHKSFAFVYNLKERARRRNQPVPPEEGIMAFRTTIQSFKRDEMVRLISIIIGSIATWFLFLSLAFHLMAKINF